MAFRAMLEGGSITTQRDKRWPSHTSNEELSFERKLSKLNPDSDREDDDVDDLCYDKHTGLLKSP